MQPVHDRSDLIGGSNWFTFYNFKDDFDYVIFTSKITDS